jgi:excisionase family DNA binding protein
MIEPRRTYTIPEAGQRLGVGRNSAYDAAKRGEIPTIKIGRRRVVPGELLDRLVAGQTLQPGIPAGSGPREIAPRQIGPRQIGANSTPPLSNGERVARQRLQRLMAAAIGEAEGDQESALAQFVDELFQQEDGAQLIWSLLSRGRADALRRLFEKVSAEPPAPSPPPKAARQTRRTGRDANGVPAAE